MEYFHIFMTNAHNLRPRNSHPIQKHCRNKPQLVKKILKLKGNIAAHKEGT